MGVPLPMEENESDQMDMICRTCVNKHPFLSHYDGKKSKEYLLSISPGNHLESRAITLAPVENNAGTHCLFENKKNLFVFCSC